MHDPSPPPQSLGVDFGLQPTTPPHLRKVLEFLEQHGLFTLTVEERDQLLSPGKSPETVEINERFSVALKSLTQEQTAALAARLGLPGLPAPTHTARANDELPSPRLVAPDDAVPPRTLRRRLRQRARARGGE